MNNFNCLVSAKDMENVTATSATVRFQDFELRTYNTIENHARQGYGSCAKPVDIPYGVCMYNHNLSNFIKRLREAGYTAIVARKNYRGATRYLFISWTMEGNRHIEDILTSNNYSVFYTFDENEEE